MTAAGRPAVLVPFPHATGDHQTANARWLERAGAATVIADAELTSNEEGDAAPVGPLARSDPRSPCLGDRGRGV